MPLPPLRHLAATALLLSACRSDPHYPRQPALDLAALPHPDPATFGHAADLQARYAATLLPAWGSDEDASFPGVAGAAVHYHIRRVANEKGAVLVIPGRTEPILKYIEVADDLARSGYSSFLLDLRGQGASARLLAQHDRGYVEFFNDYVDDLDTFVTTIVRREPHPKLFVLAHSTGGAVTLLHVDRHPDTFAAVALTAPMIEIDTGAFPPAAAFTLSATDCSLTDGTDYAPGSGDFTEETSLADSTVTHSPERWAWKVQLLHDNPPLRLGGVTYRWVCESLTATNHLAQIGHFSNTPTLLFQAGDDKVVKPGGQLHYCTDAARCQLRVVPGAYHEILQEPDPTRNQTLSETIAFFDYWSTH
jgi:lysophospholipase